ncbi:hypothetical protein Nmel_011610 [Mimus melanotis]
MASKELAQKLQRRLQLEESGEVAEGEAEAVKGAVAAGEVEERSCLTASADAELSAKLCRRQDINEGAAQPRRAAVFNPYTEFKEFSRRQIKDMERMFRLYDSGRDGYIDLMELKLMMEKLGAPQTHLGLKNMIKEVDEDFDGKLSFREVRVAAVTDRGVAAGLKEEAAGSCILWAVGSPLPSVFFQWWDGVEKPVSFPMPRVWSTVNLHLHESVIVPDAKSLQPPCLLWVHI